MSGFAVLLVFSLAPSPFWAELEPGPHEVGFEQIVAYDHSRPFRRDSATRGRPVAMSIWYPAKASSAPARIPFRRYVGEGEEVDRFAARMRTYGFPLSGEALAALLDTPTAAVEGAPRADGPFPLLVFGTALTGPSYLSTVLSEYLASHGYVSVAIPSLPYRAGVEPDYDLFAVDAQLRDMEFAIHEMHDIPGVAIDRMGLVGWSFGGIAQVLLSMKNEDVRAVVSLDAATGYLYGERLLESSLYFDPRRANAAFLHATDSRESGPVEKSFRYYDELVKGPSFLVTLEGATHAEFTSLASVVAHGFRRSNGSTDVMRRYELLCLYVRRFLDDAIGHDASAQEFLAVAPTRHGFEGIVLSRKR